MLWILYVPDALHDTDAVGLPGDQAAFVGMPDLDFDLPLPEGVHGIVPMQYLDAWVDTFISDNVLSMYCLPDHFFTQISEVGGYLICVWCYHESGNW